MRPVTTLGGAGKRWSLNLLAQWRECSARLVVSLMRRSMRSSATSFESASAEHEDERAAQTCSHHGRRVTTAAGALVRCGVVGSWNGPQWLGHGGGGRASVQRAASRARAERELYAVCLRARGLGSSRENTKTLSKLSDNAPQPQDPHLARFTSHVPHTSHRPFAAGLLSERSSKRGYTGAEVSLPAPIRL